MKKFLLGNFGPHLWTRNIARQIRGKLNDLLDGMEVGETLVIDAKGVEVFDYSFANEFFGKTILSLPNEYPGRCLIVENLTEYARENLSKALESLGLMIVEKRGTKLDLLGKVHPADKETFAVMAKAKEPLTASELTEILKINLTAMNERLAKLSGMALVLREHGASKMGRQQYQYSVPG